ncbi:unnamed protein product, partial [Heterosigma akashiwo]
ITSVPIDTANGTVVGTLAGSGKCLSHGGPNGKVSLSNCLYCHSLPYILVSVSQLMDLGYAVTFTTCEAVIITNRAGDLTWDPEMTGLPGPPDIGERAKCDQGHSVLVSDAKVQSTLDLWHHFGHICEHCIRMMARAGIIPASSIKSTDKLSFCEDCAMAKATRQPHSRKPRFDIATRPLQRLHCDVAGKFPSDSKSRESGC